MKLLLAILAILILTGSAGALTVGGIVYTAGFAVDQEALPLQRLQDTEFAPEAVEAAIEETKSLLRQSGHPFIILPYPELIPIDGTEPRVELHFQIGEALPADKVLLHFQGLRYFTEAKLRSLLLMGETQTVALSVIPSLQERVLDLYTERGYLFASVRLDSLSLEGGLNAWLSINEGKPFKPENFYFRGNKYTRDSTLLKISGLEQASVVNPAVLSAAEENILRKSYITDCQIEPLDPQSLLIKVSEGRMTSLEGVLGFTRKSGKTELTGLLDLSFLNLWGSDRSLALRWRQNPLSSMLELSYHESGPRRIPLSGDFFLSRSTQDSTWIRSSLSADIYSYFSNQRLGLELALQDIAPGVRRPILVTKSASRSIGAFWRLDSRDQQFNPSRGALTNLTYRIRYSDTGVRWSNALEAEHTQFLGLSSRWTLAAGAHLRSLDQSTADDYLLYRMGGYNSLRGYREDEFSSWRLGWAELELRYLALAGTRLHVFYNHGLYVLPDGSLRGNVFAPGLGLKVRTRLGILSIEYALGYRENGFADFGGGMIHAGLEASF